MQFCPNRNFKQESSKVQSHNSPERLSFRSLSLVQSNTVFFCLVFVLFLAWSKCILHSLLTNQSHRLEISLSSCFLIYLDFYVRKLCKYHQHKRTNH